MDTFQWFFSEKNLINETMKRMHKVHVQVCLSLCVILAERQTNINCYAFSKRNKKLSKFKIYMLLSIPQLNRNNFCKSKSIKKISRTEMASFSQIITIRPPSQKKCRIIPDKRVDIRYQPDEEQLLQGSVAIPAAPPALRSNLSALREDSLSPAL